MNIADLHVGQRVRYQPEHYGDKFENGIIKGDYALLDRNQPTGLRRKRQAGIALIWFLICILIIIVNSKAFAVPWSDAIGIRSKSKSCMVHQVKLIDILNISNYQKRTIGDLFVSRIISVGIGWASDGGYCLSRGQCNSYRQINWTFARPKLYCFSTQIPNTFSQPIQSWGEFQSSRIKYNGLGDRISAVPDTNFIPNTTTCFHVGEWFQMFNTFSHNPRPVGSDQGILSASYQSSSCNPQSNSSCEQQPSERSYRVFQKSIKPILFWLTILGCGLAIVNWAFDRACYYTRRRNLAYGYAWYGVALFGWCAIFYMLFMGGLRWLI